MTRKRYLIPLLSVLAFTAACSSNDKDDDAASSVKGGDLQKLAGGEAYSELSGYAHLVITEKTSSVEVYVTGLTPEAEYKTHVHNAWCSSDTPGGGHYLQNESGEDTAANGLWPIITTDVNGVGMGSATQKFVVSDSAKSVIIHETGDTSIRIACVNLYSSQGMSGDFSITNDGRDIYESIEGKAFISVNGNTSKAEVGITGLTANSTYKAHVHVGTCASGGEGHYLQDVAGEDVATNGLWPGANVDGFAYASGWASNDFKVRLQETKSIVVHDKDTPSIRIACADLDDSLLAFRSGSFWTTSDGEALYGEGAIQGRAKLSISGKGVSAIAVYVSGLLADTEYKAHVHSGTCATGGGKHYWQDMNPDNDVAGNGLFPVFTTDADGTAMAEVSNKFIVRPDARSVVIHEPVTGARIACADLK